MAPAPARSRAAEAGLAPAGRLRQNGRMANEANERVCEVMFYHLLRQPLERVLPPLLQKTLQRDWRALVRCGNPLRIRPLSDAIWTWREDSFIPHGAVEDGHLEHQPILIVEAEEEGAPNHADILFLVEGAPPREEDYARFQRICVLFADADTALKQRARELWKALRGREGLALTYWQQDARGRWERKG